MSNIIVISLIHTGFYWAGNNKTSTCSLDLCQSGGHEFLEMQTFVKFWLCMEFLFPSSDLLRVVRKFWSRRLSCESKLPVQGYMYFI